MHLNGIDMKNVLIDARITLKKTGIKDNDNLSKKKDIKMINISK